MADAEEIRGARTSYTIIATSGVVDDDTLRELVVKAADEIAAQIDDGTGRFDVDVVEGTFADPLSGDNIHGLGGAV